VLVYVHGLESAAIETYGPSMCRAAHKARPSFCPRHHCLVIFCLSWQCTLPNLVRSTSLFSLWDPAAFPYCILHTLSLASFSPANAMLVFWLMPRLFLLHNCIITEFVTASQLHHHCITAEFILLDSIIHSLHCTGKRWA